MSEETVSGQLTPRRRMHPVLLTVLTLLCFAGLLVFRVWYSCMYYGASAYPDSMFYALAEVGAGLILMLLVLFFRQDFMISAALPVCFLVLAFMLLGFFASFSTGVSRWLNVGPAMLYLPPLLFLLLFPLSAFTAAGRPMEIGRAALLFLLLGIVPVGLMFFGGDLEFVTVYVLVCILFALYIRKNGCLDMPGVLFWLVMLLLLAAVVALYVFRLRAHFDVLITRGQSDPEGYGVLLTQVDSIWQQIRWFGPSDLRLTISGSPWYTANAGYELIAVMIHGGAIAMAGMLVCALGLVLCLYRMHAAMQNPFARFVSFLTASVFLVETVWNLFSCFLGISARSDIPFLSADRTVFVIELLLLGAVFSLFRQRQLPLAETKGDYWFLGSVKPAEPAEPEEPQPQPEAQPGISILRDPTLKRYLRPDRFYLDTHMEMAAAEWDRMQAEAAEAGIDLPDNLSEELLPLSLLDGTLYLLVPSQSPFSNADDPAAALQPLLERTPYAVRFLQEDPLPVDSAEEAEAPADIPAAPEAPVEEPAAPVEDTDPIPALSFAAVHETGPVPDFSFNPVSPSDDSEE